MAKDPAFLFYDGDAARDMAHMNRLERGGYMDILMAQRKFGKLTISQIQKILGKDYADCWNGIEVVLDRDENLYWVGWLWDAVGKRLAHAKKQGENAQKRWNSGKPLDNIPDLCQTDTKCIPNISQPYSGLMPLVNENENEIVIEDREGKGGAGEKEGNAQPALADGFVMDVDLLAEKVFLDKQNFVRVYLGWGLTDDAVHGWLQAFNRSLRYLGQTHRPEKDYRQHFGNWLKMQDLNANPADYQPVKRGGVGMNQAKVSDSKNELLALFAEHSTGKNAFGKMTPGHYDFLQASQKIGSIDQFLNIAKIRRIQNLEGSNDGPTLRLLSDYKAGNDSDAVRADSPNIEKISKRLAVWHYFQECIKSNAQPV